MRIVLVLVLGLAVGCGKDAAPVSACDDLYRLLDKLETCTSVPGPAGLKRKAIDLLIEAARKQGKHEGLCRNEADAIRKVYELTAPDCLK